MMRIKTDPCIMKYEFKVRLERMNSYAYEYCSFIVLCVKCTLLVSLSSTGSPLWSKVCFDEERDHRYVEHIF